MEANTLTIGNVLPSDQKDKYCKAVLDTSLEDALNIAKYDMPGDNDLSDSEVAEVKEIYKNYKNKGGEDSNSDSAYWNKSEADNQAYWSRN